MGWRSFLFGESKSEQKPQGSGHSFVSQYGGPEQLSPEAQAALTEARRPKWGAEIGQESIFGPPAAAAAPPPAAPPKYNVDGINQSGFLYPSEPEPARAPARPAAAAAPPKYNVDGINQSGFLYPSEPEPARAAPTAQPMGRGGTLMMSAVQPPAATGPTGTIMMEAVSPGTPPRSTPGSGNKGPRL